MSTMILGVISDTHDKKKRTRAAVEVLQDAGAEAIIHCGDLNTPPIIEICAVLPCWFVFGNNEDELDELRRAAKDLGATCLEFGGVVELGGRRIAVTHGHIGSEIRNRLHENPDYLLWGHSHFPGEETHQGVRCINPGALHRASDHTVATLDLHSGVVNWLRVVKE